jgi:hypothetical protein
MSSNFEPLYKPANLFHTDENFNEWKILMSVKIINSWKNPLTN